MRSAEQSIQNKVFIMRLVRTIKFSFQSFIYSSMALGHMASSGFNHRGRAHVMVTSSCCFLMLIFSVGTIINSCRTFVLRIKDSNILSSRVMIIKIVLLLCLVNSILPHSTCP